jgi:hypothetical protein
MVWTASTNQGSFVMKKKTTLILIVLTLLIGLHFLWLDRFPVGMSHDEIEYVLSAKTFFKFGADLSGATFPSSLIRTGTHGIISAVPYIILSPYYGLIKLNQLDVRVPYVLLNLLTGFIIYKISLQLFKKRDIALVTGLVFLINPWSFYFSRTATDVPFALFSYCLGIYTTLKLSGKKLLIPFILFILGFLSYQGAQPILPFVVGATLLYKAGIERKSSHNNKNYRLFFLGILGFFAVYLLSGFLSKGSILTSRTGGLVFFEKEKLSQVVNEERKLSIQYPLTNLLSNKATALANELTEKYLTAFSPNVLFLHGDLMATYHFGAHGLLYLLDLFFIPIGLFSIFQKNRKEFYFLISIIAIAPVSTAISAVETSVINRSFLLLPIFTLVSGYGLYLLFTFLSKKIGRILGVTLLAVLLLISFLNFFVFYFFRFPVTQHENYFMSERIIANFLLKNGLEQDTYVLAQQPREVFLETIFYSYSYLPTDILDRSNYSNLLNGNYNLKAVKFMNNCPKQDESKGATFIAYTAFGKCLPEKSKYSIIENQYGGVLYLINKSSMCEKYTNEFWRRFFFVSDYSLEKLTIPEFCNRWIFLQQ